MNHPALPGRGGVRIARQRQPCGISGEGKAKDENMGPESHRTPLRGVRYRAASSREHGVALCVGCVAGVENPFSILRSTGATSLAENPASGRAWRACERRALVRGRTEEAAGETAYRDAVLTALIYLSRRMARALAAWVATGDAGRQHNIGR